MHLVWQHVLQYHLLKASQLSKWNCLWKQGEEITRNMKLWASLRKYPLQMKAAGWSPTFLMVKVLMYCLLCTPFMSHLCTRTPYFPALWRPVHSAIVFYKATVLLLCFTLQYCLQNLLKVQSIPHVNITKKLCM